MNTLYAKINTFTPITLAENAKVGNYRYTLTKPLDPTFLPVVQESVTPDYDFGDYSTNYGDYQVFSELLTTDGVPVAPGVLSAVFSNVEPVIAQAPASVDLTNVLA